MRIVVLGGGYAGLTLARRLESTVPSDVELLLVDETGTHLLQHELHRVVRRPSFADDIELSLRDVLDRTTVRRARVERVDHQANSVILEDGATIEYDFAGVCLGAETNFYGLPGVEEHATPLKRLAHARRIRAKFLDVLDAGGGAVIVGGAGLSGVQLAGELAAFAREEGASNRVTVTLLEQQSHVAPGFPANFREAVRERLERSGVEIRTDVTVESATATELAFENGRRRSYDQFVWTGGIRGPGALGGDRPSVRSSLRLGDGTFVVGDTAQVVDSDGELVPASAQAAVREARTAATNISRLVEYEREGGGTFEPRLKPFRFDSPGWLVSVGDDAVAQVGPSVFTGRAAHALKASIGAGYLSSVGAVQNAADLVRAEFEPEANE